MAGESPAAVIVDTSENELTLITDGANHAALTQGKIQKASGAVVNPATEEKQDSIIGHVDGVETKLDTLNAKDFATETTLATLATQATAAAIQAVLEAIRDTSGIKKITDELPSGTNLLGKIQISDTSNELDIPMDGETTASKSGIGILGKTSSDLFRWLSVDNDGKLVVSAQPPSPPPGTTEFVLSQQEVDLVIDAGDSPADADSAIIANGLNLYLQAFSAGAAGDPSERGSKVEIYWVEGSPEVEHIIERLFVGGASVDLTLPNVNKARDGTQMTGNGTNTKLRLRRVRLSNSAQEVDGEVRGYTE